MQRLGPSDLGATGLLSAGPRDPSWPGTPPQHLCFLHSPASHWRTRARPVICTNPQHLTLWAARLTMLFVVFSHEKWRSDASPRDGLMYGVRIGLLPPPSPVTE